MKKLTKKKKIIAAFSGAAIIAGASATGVGTSILMNRNPYEKFYFTEEQALETIYSAREIFTDWDHEWEEGTVQQAYKQSWLDDTNASPDNPLETRRDGIISTLNSEKNFPWLIDSNNNEWRKESSKPLGSFTRIKRVIINPNLVEPSWDVGTSRDTGFLPGHDYVSFSMIFSDPDLSIIVENSNGNDYKITFTEYEKNELINKRPKNHNKTSVLSVRWGFSPGDEYLNQYRVYPHHLDVGGIYLDIV